jgi:hypothetical protein
MPEYLPKLQKTAACASCGKIKKLTVTQQYRLLKPGHSITCGKACLSALKKQQMIERWDEHRSIPQLVQCSHCSCEFLPSAKVWNNHTRGERNYYFCGECHPPLSFSAKLQKRHGLDPVPETEEQRKHKEFLQQYFALEACGKLPELNIYRRTW